LSGPVALAKDFPVLLRSEALEASNLHLTPRPGRVGPQLCRLLQMLCSKLLHDNRTVRLPWRDILRLRNPALQKRKMVQTFGKTAQWSCRTIPHNDRSIPAHDHAILSDDRTVPTDGGMILLPCRTPLHDDETSLQRPKTRKTPRRGAKSSAPARNHPAQGVPLLPEPSTYRHQPTNDTTAWVTAANGANYFTAGPNPVLTCTLPQQSLVSELVIWGYGGNANEAKSFEVAFSTDGINFAYSDFVTQPTLLGAGAARLVFLGGLREATHVRLRITANHFFTGPAGGDRVGLGEIRFAGQPSQVIVSNLGNTRFGDDFLDTTNKVSAHAFTTGPAPLVLSSLTLRVWDAGAGFPSVRVKLCADTGTAPGTVLADLGLVTVTNTALAGNVTWNPAPGTAPGALLPFHSQERAIPKTPKVPAHPPFCGDKIGYVAEYCSQAGA